MYEGRISGPRRFRPQLRQFAGSILFSRSDEHFQLAPQTGVQNDLFHRVALQGLGGLLISEGADLFVIAVAGQ